MLNICHDTQRNVRPSFHFVVTKNCNYACKHCYLSAGPGKEGTTIDDEDFVRVLEHLPKLPLHLTLSGGELFSLPGQPYGFLELVGAQNEERAVARHGSISVSVQTNGSWATDDAATKSVLFDLASHGVSGIDIPSHDHYHRLQGASLQKLERLAALAEESGLFDSVGLRGSPRRSIAPVGRAARMGLRPSELRTTYNGNCRGALDDYSLSIRPDGSIDLCCMRPVALPGNAIEEPVVDSVRRARNDPFLAAVNREGVVGWGRLLGYSRSALRTLIEERGRCGACFTITRESERNGGSTD